GPEKLLQEFVAKCNVNKFNLTLNYHNIRLEFLDTEIKVDNHGQVSTNLYRKKTAGKSLLHAQSMHPHRCIEGIPKGQYIRLRSICSTDEDFYERPSNYIRDLNHGKHSTQFPSSKAQEETRLVLTFNTNDKEICSLVYKHWNILSKDPIVGQLVPSRPLFCYRRNISIGDSLTHSHFQQQSRVTCCKTLGSYKCGACEQCQYIKVPTNFGNRNVSYDMYHYICCTTTHVIYLFTCHYGSKYVGKTKRPFRRRIYEHMRDIRNCNLLSAIAKHIFCIHNGYYTGSYFQGIDRLHGYIRGGDLDNKLLQLETT
ncbi:hypothetical protein XELAEV_18029179mg, partial [Xenopus laevis]